MGKHALLTPERVDAEELLDEHDAPWDAMARSLRDLQSINRYAGGRPIYRRLIRMMLRGTDRPVTILDLGTGTSDLLDSLSLDCPMRRLGLDFKIDHLLYGKQFDTGSIDRIAGEAQRLPIRDASVDIVTSAHFFHHFSPDENVAILSEALRVARIGVAVNDTRRHIVPLLFVRALGALGLVGEITRADAPASVLRGYTIEEASSVAERVPCRRYRIVRMFPFRFGLMLWK